MENNEDEKKKKRFSLDKENFKAKALIVGREIKPILKKPKTWIAIFLIWYIETPFIVLSKKGFINTDLLSLFINPFKLLFEFISSLNVILGFIKLNLMLIFLFIIVCLVMHLFGMETGKIIDVNKIVLLKDMLSSNEGDFKYAKSGEYGTAKWATVKSIEKANRDNKNSHADPYVAITPSGKDGLLFGYWMNPNGTNSKKIITLPKKTSLNRNVAVFGSSGSMKSRSFVIPNILNLIENNESLFVTDPKGELLSKTYDVLVANGYTVKAFNINNIPCSDRWNVLQEINDEQTAAIFAKSIVENTRIGNKIDEFWENHYINFLKAVALYVRYNEERENQNMGKVYEYITYEEGLDGLRALFNNIDNNHPAKQSWIAFNTAAGNEKVASGVMSGLAIKLDTLQISSFRDLLSGNDIDLTAPGREKCAYFVVVPDTHATFNFLAGLFFTFAFINLINFADKLGDSLPYHVNFLLDEFPNIAKIPDFEKKISTVRSRGVSICVIFQTLLQLESRYSKEIASEILGNCDSKVFLGANEIETATYISKMLGDATIEVETKMKGAFSIFDEKVSTGLAKRELAKPNEILKKPRTQSYVMLSGLDPIKAIKMDYTRHSMGDEVNEHYIYDMLKGWSSKYHEKYLEEMCVQLRKAINKVEDVKNSDSEVQNVLNNIALETTSILEESTKVREDRIKSIQENSLNDDSIDEVKFKNRTEDELTKEQAALNLKSLISSNSDEGVNEKLEKLEKTLIILEEKLSDIKNKEIQKSKERDLYIDDIDKTISESNDLKELQELDTAITKIINSNECSEEQLGELMKVKNNLTNKKEKVIEDNKNKISNRFSQMLGNIKSIINDINLDKEKLDRARELLNQCEEFAKKENLSEIQIGEIDKLNEIRNKLSDKLHAKEEKAKEERIKKEEQEKLREEERAKLIADAKLAEEARLKEEAELAEKKRLKEENNKNNIKDQEENKDIKKEKSKIVHENTKKSNNTNKNVIKETSSPKQFNEKNNEYLGKNGGNNADLLYNENKKINNTLTKEDKDNINVTSSKDTESKVKEVKEVKEVRKEASSNFDYDF